jgi:hypothetical protein
MPALVIHERRDFVMAGHSRLKNGVASLACVPAIHDLSHRKKTWMPGTRPGMTSR